MLGFRVVGHNKENVARAVPLVETCGISHTILSRIFWSLAGRPGSHRAQDKEEPGIVVGTHVPLNESGLHPLCNSGRRSPCCCTRRGSRDFAQVVLHHREALADEFEFFDACREGDAEAVKMFVDAQSMDLNYADEDGHTPLVLAVNQGHVDVVEVLVDGGADIELASDYPADVDCPLSAAASHGHLDLVKLLLEKGASIEGRGKDGRTALMTAAAKGRLGAVVLLLDKGANVDAGKIDGTTPLFWASHGGHADVVSADT